MHGFTEVRPSLCSGPTTLSSRHSARNTHIEAPNLPDGRRRDRMTIRCDSALTSGQPRLSDSGLSGGDAGAVAELEALDLAGGRLGQLDHEVEGPRTLEVGQPRAHVVAQ